MRWRDRACVAAVLAGSLAFAAPTGLAAAVPSGAPAALRPSDLIGVWRPIVEGAPAGTKLRFDSGGWAAYNDDCGTGWDGTWKTIPSGQFVADVSSWSDCYVGMSNWLDGAVAFRPKGAAIDLFGADGRVVVTLKPVMPERDRRGHRLPRPAVSEAQREKLDVPPADPPAGLVPASRESLVGRWVPPAFATERRAGKTHVDVAEDGTWRGWEQCTGTVGRWVVRTDGRILTTAAGMNLVACWAIPVVRWRSRAAWIGFLGPALVLVDADGDVLGHLFPYVRGGPAAGSIVADTEP